VEGLGIIERYVRSSIIRDGGSKEAIETSWL